MIPATRPTTRPSAPASRTELPGSGRLGEHAAGSMALVHASPSVGVLPQMRRKDGDLPSSGKESNRHVRFFAITQAYATQ